MMFIGFYRSKNVHKKILTERNFFSLINLCFRLTKQRQKLEFWKNAFDINGKLFKNFTLFK